jgi:maltooligosyltrehalose trehalohydrolase
LDLYRRLSTLRRERTELTDPRLTLVRTRHDDEQRWLAVERGDLRILINFAEQPRVIPLPGGPGEVLLATAAGVVQADGEAAVPALTAVVIGPPT